MSRALKERVNRNLKRFPEGIAVLSTVLNSDRAIEVNIKIMRTFIKLREYILTHKDLKFKIERNYQTMM